MRFFSQSQTVAMQNQSICVIARGDFGLRMLQIAESFLNIFVFAVFAEHTDLALQPKL